METSVYVTTSSIGKGSGGGIVAYNEILALKSVSKLEAVIGRKVQGWKIFDIIPEAYAYSLDIPFLFDYFAANSSIWELDLNIIHFNGNPFNLTVQRLKNKYPSPKIFVTVPAHNLEVSIEEFNRLGVDYPFVHMTDPYLWDLYTRHIRMADIVICPSWLSAKYLEQKLKLKNEIAVIPHGCYLPERAEPIPEKFDVAYLGQFGPDKGLIYLIKAWSQLYLPDSTLILAGGNPDYGSQLIKLANGVGNYHLPGYVPDVSEIYNKCSVYIQPSVTEGFGIEVLEAMAHSRPVIVTEGCGACELIENGKEGFIVPIRNPEAIADIIRYFYDNPREIRRMGRNARLKAQSYSWSKIRKMYEEVYVER